MKKILACFSNQFRRKGKSLSVALLAVSLSACQLDLKSKDSDAQPGLGSVNLTLWDEASTSTSMTSRTLTPDVSLDAASFKVVGDGPNGRSVNVVTNGGAQIKLDNLSLGQWNFMVEATNDEGYLYSRGSVETEITSDQPIEETVVLSLLENEGSFELTVNVPNELSSDPYLIGHLESSTHPDVALWFNKEQSIDDYHVYKIVPVSNLVAGYYTLNLKVYRSADMLEEPSEYTGLVDAVQIMEGQTTSGSVTTGNAPGLQGNLNIEFDLNPEIPVFIVDAESYSERYTYNAGYQILFSAEVPLDDPDVASIDYDWYLNNEKVGSGQTYLLNTLGSATTGTKMTFDLGVDLSAQADVVGLTDPGPFGITVDLLQGDGPKTISVSVGEIFASVTPTKQLSQIISKLQEKLDAELGAGQLLVTSSSPLATPLTSPTYLEIQKPNSGGIPNLFSMSAPTGNWNALFGDPVTDVTILQNVSLLPPSEDDYVVAGSHTRNIANNVPLSLSGFVGGTHTTLNSTIYNSGTVVGDFSGANSIVFDIEVTDFHGVTTSGTIYLDDVNLGFYAAVPSAVTIDEIQSAINSQIAINPPLASILTVNPGVPISFTDNTTDPGATIQLVPKPSITYSLDNIGFASSNRMSSGVADVEANNEFRITVTGPSPEENSNTYNIIIPAANYASHADLASAIQSEINSKSGVYGLTGRVSVSATGNNDGISFTNTQFGSGYNIAITPSTAIVPPYDSQALSALGFDSLTTYLGTDHIAYKARYLPGEYRLDVIASNGSQTRKGSASFSFELVDTEANQAHYLFDFTAMGNQIRLSIEESHFSVSSSTDLSLNELTGLGSVGGIADKYLDSGEKLTIQFNQPVSYFAYTVVDTMDNDADGRVGESTLHIYDDQGGVSTVQSVIHLGKVVATAFYGSPITKIEIEAEEGFSLGKLKYALAN